MNQQNLFLLFLSLNYSCISQTKDDSQVDMNIFSSNQLGWTMPVPKHWEIVQRENLEVQANKGLKMIDTSNSDKFKEDLLKTVYLLSFKKDKRKMFTALATPNDTTIVSFEMQNRNSKNALFYSLKKQGIRVDSTWGKEYIQSKAFTTFTITAYDKSNNPFVNQIYYNRQIDNYMFSVIIMYDDTETKDLLMDYWKKSKFER